MALEMLRAYFDETGTHQRSDAVTICGLIASVAEWDAFDLAWREQLAVEKVSYFHAYECEHGEGEEFSRLSRGLRESLFWGLGDVIANSLGSIVNGGILIEHWNSPDFKTIRTAFRSPWHLSMAYCLQQLSDVSRERFGGAPIEVVFSDQQEFESHARTIYEIYTRRKKDSNLASLQFASMKKFPGLQAADFVCYEIHQNHLFGVATEDDVKRIAMKRLLLGKTIKFSSPFAPGIWRGWAGLNS
jgi:hypothetical protein